MQNVCGVMFNYRARMRVMLFRHPLMSDCTHGLVRGDAESIEREEQGKLASVISID